ncbi:MAG: hypothetical protein AAF960_22625, partial [Bacteroidota bacterium]
MKFIIYLLGSIVLILLILALIYFRFVRNHIFRLPLRRKGFKNAPAWPFNIRRTVSALIGLLRRAKATEQAKFGLTGTRDYHIGGHRASGYAFCYAKNNHRLKLDAYAELLNQLRLNPFSIIFGKGFIDNETQGVKTKAESEATARRERNYEDSKNQDNFSDGDKVDLTVLSLEDPKDFDISWTTFGNIRGRADTTLKEKWAQSLTDANEASKQFFETIANYGVAYNLLILQKVTTQNLGEFKTGELAKVWTQEMDDLCQAGKLYVIDMRIFDVLTPQITNEKPLIWSYTPATFTWLKQDEHKDVTPFAVYIKGYDTEYVNKQIGRKEHISTSAQFYNFSDTKDTTWIYALQAAKVSITVFGIWLGHVYPWHLVTAAMSMTLYNYMDKNSFLYQLLNEKCNHLIGFNDALYLEWRTAAPPTSINTTTQFLTVVDKYAVGRSFYDDDPATILEKMGIQAADFTVHKPWDKFPMVKHLLDIHKIVGDYVQEFTRICYEVDEGNTKEAGQRVQRDANLQNWIQKSIDKGNIQGLKKITSVAALNKFLTNFIYRFTVHGLSRIDSTANPAMTFVPNFPPTLHIKENPAPNEPIDTKRLLEYLPKTGTIGKMLDFYFTFADSAPYTPLVPVDGIDQHLHFSNIGNAKSKNTKQLNNRGLDRDTGKAGQLNRALVKFRRQLCFFMDRYNDEHKIEGFEADPVQYNQWP